MSVQLALFSPSDLLDIEVRDVHFQTWAHLVQYRHKVPQPARTVFSEHGQVVACFGMLSDNKVWALFSKNAKPHARSVVKLLRALINTQNCEIRATIRPQDAKAVRLAETLGFKWEQGDIWCAGSSIQQT